jgi:hypothetical protein
LPGLKKISTFFNIFLFSNKVGVFKTIFDSEPF